MVDSKKQWKAWLYLSPAIVLLLIFTVWPIVNTLMMAFQNGFDTNKALGGATFQFGFENFKVILTDKYAHFVPAILNTFLLCFITVPLSTVLALIIAVCLNSIKPLQKFLQTIFFLPYVTNSLAIGLVFVAMFSVVGKGSNPETTGVVNSFIAKLTGNEGFFVDWISGIRMDSYREWLAGTNILQGIKNSGLPEVFKDYFTSMVNGIPNLVVLVVFTVWNALPFKILIFLGGLQSINKQYYEAAKIDSTPKLRVFTRITVPLLSPMISYVVITGFIGGFKEYSNVVAIFGGTGGKGIPDMGPMNDPARFKTMVGIIYDFLKQNQGRASAAAIILFIIIFAVTMVNLKISNKNTHY